MLNLVQPLAAPEMSSSWPHRIRMFGIDVDAVTMAEALSVVERWIGHMAKSPKSQKHCPYVVTPNVDHIVLLQRDSQLRSAYQDAGLVLADGWPIVNASRWLGTPLPERVAGSDLVPALFEAARNGHGLRTYLLGAAPGVGLRAAKNIQSRWPAVEVVGVDSPALGFEHRPEENQDILVRIADVKPDVLIVAFGAPKQELWVHANQHAIRSKVAICAGATIDFLAGEKRRAPHWMRRVGLEWMHRLMSEPRRLGPRYLRDALIFPQLVWRERQAAKK